jgi:hypothetical protein
LPYGCFVGEEVKIFDVENYMYHLQTKMPVEIEMRNIRDTWMNMSIVLPLNDSAPNLTK